MDTNTVTILKDQHANYHTFIQHGHIHARAIFDAALQAAQPKVC
jgi:hypothetical protein